MSEHPATPILPATLTVVVPTFNEAANVTPLVERLDAALAGVSWEVVFVDDHSPDNTARRVRELARQHPRVRCLERLGRRGLGSACIEGFLASSASYVAVMDADLQHDETLLPRMLDVLKAGTQDLVIGSRNAPGGSHPGLTPRRARLSRLGARLGRVVLPTGLEDPMSGFFMISREAFERCVPRLSGIGFKILLDIMTSSPEPLRYEELPYGFRPREAGTSKLDQRAVWDYGMLLLDKLVGRWVPVRFAAFALVGGSGVLVHMAVLFALYQAMAVSFVFSQIAATIVAMITNFTINNVITYADKRLHGAAWFRGLISFSVVCSVGAIANVGIASLLFGQETYWALAGFAGILVSAVWNYSVTKLYTWKAG